MTRSLKNPDIKSQPVKTQMPTTKKAQLIKLLSAKAGADIKTLSEELGWQQHTTRAAMSGLRKAGYEVAGEKPAKGGSARYRILAVPVTKGSTEASHGA